MWCKNCRQDVPGISSIEAGAFHCARCGSRVGRKKALSNSLLATDICDAGIDLAQDEPAIDPDRMLRTWEDDEQLDQARRLLRSTTATGRSKPENEPRIRFDPPASGALRVPLPAANAPVLPTPHMRPAATRRAVSRTSHLPKTSPWAVIAWGVVSCGLMGMVCGGVLMIWSFATGRADLWTLGAPTALGGQGVLLIGILWAILTRRKSPELSSRRDHELLVAEPQTMDAASSQMMLSELRGQLDFLASQLSGSSPLPRSW